MPFTPSHAAIVLPFIRLRNASATGLIIGSMSPDFEYFLRFSTEGTFGHTGWGILFFDIPITVMLAWVFHRVVKQNFIQNLPVFFRDRFQDTLAFDFTTYLKSHVIIFLLSATIGIVSHILWDNFTHGDGYFVRELSFYKRPGIPHDGARYPLFYVLQNVSTAIGLFLVILYAALKKPMQTVHDEKPSLLYWLVLLVITGLVVAIRFAIRNDDNNLGTTIVTIISGLCVASVITGFMKFKRVTTA